MSKLIPASAAALALTFALSSCGSDEDSSTSSSTPTASSDASAGSPETGRPGTALTVTDPWAKTAESGMTSVFGTLTNTTDADLTLTAAATPAAKMVELHETTVGSDGASTMQEKEGGFVIPAGASFDLAPGGNHLMLMGLTGPIKAGDSIAVTLTLENGQTIDFDAIGKDFAGAQETYAPEAEHSGMAH